jgi:hypothetical protein
VQRGHGSIATTAARTYQLVKVVGRVGKHVWLDVEQGEVLKDDLFKLEALLGRVGVVKAHDHLALVLVGKVLMGREGGERKER